MKLDVERALRGEPVEAREGARLYVISRTLRRYRWAAAAVGGGDRFPSRGIGRGGVAGRESRAGTRRGAARRGARGSGALQLDRPVSSGDQRSGLETSTAKGMIDLSAQRVLKEYRDQPQLAGQVVLTLADLYGALEDANGAASLLEGFLAEADSKADPSRSRTRAKNWPTWSCCAGMRIARRNCWSRPKLSGAHSPRAISRRKASKGWPSERALQRARGDLDGSIATTRDAIAQRIALSGHDNRETAVLFNSLAITLGTVNRRARSAQGVLRNHRHLSRAGLGRRHRCTDHRGQYRDAGNARGSFARGRTPAEEFRGAGAGAGGRLRRGCRRDELLRPDSLGHQPQ